MKNLYQSNIKRIVLLETDQEVLGLLNVLEQISTDLGWQPASQLRDYRHRAIHIEVYEKGTCAGGLQMVAPLPQAGMPYQKVWPEVVPSSSEAHITILALKPQYRGRASLFWPLCVELWRVCQEQGISSIVLEATPATLRLYRRIGWPLEIIGDLRPHWGDDLCYLCQMDTHQVAQSVTTKARCAETYHKITEQAFRDEQLLQTELAS